MTPDRDLSDILKMATTKRSLSILLVFCAGIELFASSGDYENRIREAEISGDRQQVSSLCKEWYANGTHSPGLLNWNYNALMSADENALLFTQQDVDTYPALLLQYALNVRPDISIISIAWLEDPRYRSFLIDAEGFYWISKESSVSDFLVQVLHPKGTKLAPTKPVYFGSMVHKSQLLADKEKLYLTGLAFKFSPDAFDNLAVLRNNFENLFRTDYLELNFEPETDPGAVARANLNYIPALLLLHRHYAAAGELEKAERLQNLALRIARAGDRENEVRAFFTPIQPAAGFITSISPKNLEKGMKKVGEHLYAAETETTNAQYEAFLSDLLKNKDFDQLAMCKTVKTDWVSLLPKELQDLPSNELFEHGHPDGPEFPVQNISHAAAQRYCAWMTQVYNASTEKRKFKKVLFRLPTEEEWMAAAMGGIKESPYPWGGYYIRNAKGCYLANLHVLEPCGNCPGQTLSASVSDPISGSNAQPPLDPSGTQAPKLNPRTSNDGGFFTVRADSYFPNRFGLYATTGNVAEMLAEPGKTKGGSWNDIPYYGQITTVKTVNTPSPEVGFRVFMEVIEE